tara:strand:- start:53 stop:721 length:669 start_codon:yes stop_codon:yes gene_type:complete
MLSHIIGTNLKFQKKIVKTDQVIKSKYICLYFSASWCRPCKNFTPILCNFYNKYKKEKDFEIVLIPFKEKDTESFNLYYEGMPWYCTTRMTNYIKLKDIYECLTVPFLVIIDQKGKIISNTAKTDLIKDLGGKNFPWKNSKIKKNINYSLYADYHPKESMKGLGYSNKNKAIITIEKIKKKPMKYQMAVVNTMKNRAKYHKYQTKEMLEAIKIFDKWLENHR